LPSLAAEFELSPRLCKVVVHVIVILLDGGPQFALPTHRLASIGHINQLFL